MSKVLKVLDVLLWVGMVGVPLVYLLANRRRIGPWLRAQNAAWMSRPRRERRGVVILVLVVFGYFAVITIAQDASARRAIERIGDVQAYWDGLRGGMSGVGAEAYSRYVVKVQEIDIRYHTLVANGDLKELPAVVTMTPEQYLERHPEFVRTAEEEARWDPCFRAQVTGEPIPEDHLKSAM